MAIVLAKSPMGRARYAINDMSVTPMFTALLTSKTTATSFRCSCGSLNGSINNLSICSDCGTKCEESNFDSILRIDAPKSKRFITPHLFASANYAISTRNGDILSSFAGAKTDITATQLKMVNTARALMPNYVKGHEWLVDNLYDIMTVFAGLVSKVNAGRIASIMELIKNRPELVFVDFINLPTNGINEQDGNKMRLTSQFAVEAAINGTKLNNRAGRALDVQESMQQYIESEHRESHSKKSSITRQRIVASSANHTGRQTIVPIDRPHELHDISLSYRLALVMFQDYLFNTLIKQGMNGIDAEDRITNAINTFDPELRQILIDIFVSRKDGGEPIVMLRNPTQTFGSIFKARIVHIHSDPEDRTIQFSGNAVGPPNADHDGDQMHIHGLIDDYMSMRYEGMKMYNVMSDVDTPYDSNSSIATLVDCTNVMINFIKHRKT